MTTTFGDTQIGLRSRAAAASTWVGDLLEALAVLVSPGVLYVVLRLRGMGPAQLPDPSMHTTFIVDPHDIFMRYEAMFTPSSRLREAARVGFLVPARISYLLFGGVPGFFVFRYVLALIAIVPVYMLLRKVYGRWAGFVGITVVMSSPVVITALGTDYPDSAAVAYLTGGLAALALSCLVGRWRTGWLLGAGALLTLAVWSHGVSVPLVVVMIVVYVGVRLVRERAHLARDLVGLGASAVVVTVLSAIGSKLLLGQLNFITPTLRSATSLSTAAALRANHSSSWSWAPYDCYLLVPPAVVLSFIVVISRTRSRRIGTTQLFIGLTAALQLATFLYLQFIGSFQALEMHYFSSTLWSSINILLAITLIEITRPFLGRSGLAGANDRASPAQTPSAAPAPASSASSQLARRAAGAVPALLVLAVALAYEAVYRAGVTVPALTWNPWGIVLALILCGGAVVGRLTIELARPVGGRRPVRAVAAGPLAAAAVVIIVGAALVLTVATPVSHTSLAGTVFDPPPPYAQALGGNDTAYVSQYRVITELPGFVGPAKHHNQVMLTWEPSSQYPELLGPMGIYHNAFTWVSQTFPVMGPAGGHQIASRRAAQVLLMSLTGKNFAQAVRSIATRFHPRVVKKGILSHGYYHLHVWLVDLLHQRRHPARPRAVPPVRPRAVGPVRRHGRAPARAHARARARAPVRRGHARPHPRPPAQRKPSNTR